MPRASCLMSRASCLMPHESCLMPRASHLMPHASCLMSRASCLMPRASCMPHASCLMPHSSRAIGLSLSLSLLPPPPPHGHAVGTSGQGSLSRIERAMLRNSRPPRWRARVERTINRNRPRSISRSNGSSQLHSIYFVPVDRTRRVESNEPGCRDFLKLSIRDRAHAVEFYWGANN